MLSLTVAPLKTQASPFLQLRTTASEPSNTKTSVCVFPKLPLSAERELMAMQAQKTLANYTEYLNMDSITQSFNPTHTIQTPERNRLRERLAQEAYDKGAERKERKIHIIIGNLAAGKSYLLGQIQKHEGAMLVDPDLISEKLPEYNFNQGVGMAVHAPKTALAMNNLVEETWGITKEVLRQGMEHGDNIVIPYIGGSVNDEVSLAQEFKKHGYSIYYHYVDVPTADCVVRAVKRFHEAGRFTNLSKMAATGNRPWQTFQTLGLYGLERGLIDGAFRWDNSGSKGSTPRLMEVRSLHPMAIKDASTALDLVC